MDTKETKKRKFTRSPSYPSIDLESAIELAEIIKLKEGGGSHYVPYQSVVGHWGYKPGSGPGALKLAALKKFGLIEDRGNVDKREIKLTDLAMKILFYKNDFEHQHIYIEALQEAALNPSIHKELWDKWSGNIPSDQTIGAYLLLHRDTGKFAEASVEGFISQFRTTVFFANLQKNDAMFEHVEDKIIPLKEKTMLNPPKDTTNNKDINMLDIPIPFEEATGRVIIPYPLSIKGWDMLDAILKAYKPKEEKVDIGGKDSIVNN